MDAKLIKFEIKDLPDLCIVGKEVIVKLSEFEKHNPIPEFWHKCHEDSIFDVLSNTLSEYVYDPSHVGYMQMLNENEFTNVCGIMMKPGVPVPEGYVVYSVEAYTAGIGWIQGKEPDIYIGEHSLTEPAVKEAGYKYDEKKGFSIEVYNCPRFTTVDENGNRVLDYYIPIVKQ